MHVILILITNIQSGVQIKKHNTPYKQLSGITKCQLHNACMLNACINPEQTYWFSEIYPLQRQNVELNG